MTAWNKLFKSSLLLLWVVFLLGLAASLANVQPVVAEPQKSANRVDVFQPYEAAQLNASDGAASDAFGWSVAVNGSRNIIVVGATGDDSNKGSAYVFVKPGGGWHGVITETAKLIASDGLASDLFGYSVGISNDTIIVAAPNLDGSKGAAYIFLRPDSGWSGTLTETAKLTASDGLAGDSFGTSVALSHDTAIVSADSDTIGPNTGQGSAYVFVKPGSGWSGMLTETAKLIASDGVAEDAFGTSARISGNMVVVGARSDNRSHPGSVYVSLKPDNGWSGALTETAKLIPSDGVAGDFFGVSVGISGDTVVSGAIFHNLDQGAAYTFVKPEIGWSGTLTETAKLVVSDGKGGDRFGVAIAISGQTIAAGADQVDSWGAAYVFAEPESDWHGTLTETTKLTATNGETNDLLGISIAISGGTIVAGAINGNNDKGTAYVFISNLVYLPVLLK